MARGYPIVVGCFSLKEGIYVSSIGVFLCWGGLIVMTVALLLTARHLERRLDHITEALKHDPRHCREERPAKESDKDENERVETMIKLTVQDVKPTVTPIPDELVFCPGCGKELGRRPKILFEEISDQGATNGPIRAHDDKGHPLDLGQGRYIYVCPECAKRWSEHDRTPDA